MKYIAPLVIFIAMAVTLFYGLQQDPRKLESVLIDRPLPELSFATLGNEEVKVSTKNFIGQPALINYWATWCPTCRAEHDVLMKLAAEQGVPIYGINYKDESDAAQKWLKQLGNPYLLSLSDESGRSALDFGVYGTPETFIIDAQGRIKYRHAGAISMTTWNDKMKPIWESIQ